LWSDIAAPGSGRIPGGDPSYPVRLRPSGQCPGGLPLRKTRGTALSPAGLPFRGKKTVATRPGMSFGGLRNRTPRRHSNLVVEGTRQDGRKT